MCDFIPGYVATFCNTSFTKLAGDIIIVGQDDGKVYQLFSNKYDFFEKIRSRSRSRSSRKKMMCYYRNLDFTQAEMEHLWAQRIFPVSESERANIVNSWSY
jgi:hypothetical protein